MFSRFCELTANPSKIIKISKRLHEVIVVLNTADQKNATLRREICTLEKLCTFIPQGQINI